MAFLQHSANLRLACSVLCGSWDSMFHESFRDRKGANSALFSDEALTCQFPMGEQKD